MQRFSYYWLHYPTHARGVSSFRGTRAEFLETLNKWNAAQAGVWQYWY